MSPSIPFDECLSRLDQHCGRELLAGALPAAMLADDGPQGPYADAIRMLVDWVPIRAVDQPVARNELIQALGPLRLRYQAGNSGDPAHYRALAQLIRAIDAVFDDACLG